MTKYRKPGGGEKVVYHTDLDNCSQIDAETAIEITDRFVEWHGMRECEFCAGTVEIHNTGDTNNASH